MRRRIFLVVVSFVAVLVVALGLPLATALVDRATQQLFISRVSDTAWLADTAETSMQTGRLERLRVAVQRYEHLYAVRSCVVNVDSRVVLSSPSWRQNSPRVQGALVLALAGRPSLPPGRLWPWVQDPLVVAEPIVRDNRILGVVTTVSDTSRVRSAITRPLVLIVLGGFAALLVAVVAFAMPVAGWVLRPVRELDHATHEIASGLLTTRVPTEEGTPELRRLAQSFNNMADSVTAALQKQRDFVAEASHRLRNPLAALRLRLENVRELVDDRTPSEELDFALRETRRLSDMVDAMLELARAETSQRGVEVVDATSVVRERVEAWRPAYATTNTPLTYQASEGLAALCAPSALEHGLDVLLDNALKYASGAPVQVSAWTDRDMVMIEVVDSGPGLTEDELTRAGNRFWRSSRHQNLRGSGLGLALARSEIEPFEGGMAVRRADTDGLAVTLWVPCAPWEAVEGISDAPGGTIAAPPDADPADRSRSLAEDRCADPRDAL